MSYRVFITPKPITESRSYAKEQLVARLEDFHSIYNEQPLGMVVNHKAWPYVSDAVKAIGFTRPARSEKYVLTNEFWFRIRPSGFRLFSVGNALANSPEKALRDCLERAAINRMIASLSINPRYRYTLIQYSRIAMEPTYAFEYRGISVTVTFNPEVMPYEIWLKKEEQ